MSRYENCITVYKTQSLTERTQGREAVYMGMSYTVGKGFEGGGFLRGKEQCNLKMGRTRSA